MVLVHGEIVSPHLISTHPLNLFGLVYHAPIIATVWLVSQVYWPHLRRLWISPYVTRFGRHALLAFVIHVYLVRGLGVLDYLVPQPPWVNYLLILASLLAMNAIVRRYELSQAMPQPLLWARAVRGLFK